jgi:hypothetical protein
MMNPALVERRFTWRDTRIKREVIADPLQRHPSGTADYLLKRRHCGRGNPGLWNQLVGDCRVTAFLVMTGTLSNCNKSK